MVAIFVGIRLVTTSAIRIRVVIVIRIVTVTGGMPVAGGRVVAVMAEAGRRTRMVVDLAVAEERDRRIRLEVQAVAVVLVSRWHATVVTTDRGVV